MGLFSKLFGRKSPAAPSAQPAPASVGVSHPAASADPRQDPNLIQVFDSYGREFFITKDQWRKDILPVNLKKAWNDPEQLYAVIFSALNDGFRADVLDAAKQLNKIDPDRMRGTCVWGIVLMEEGRLDEAEKVFTEFVATRGEEGIILTNLAKVHSRRGDDRKAEEILWRALELDPNQENGADWFYAIHKDRSGAEAWIAAVRKVAALPRSWRPQLWLAREELKAGRLADALTFYRQSLQRAPIPPPDELLMQMSGDLGRSGHLKESIALTAPHFDAKVHGLKVGNNLIKAHLDLGRLDEGREIIEALYAQNRLDWKETLNFWETELHKARLAATPVPQEELAISMAAIDGPIWLPQASPAKELFTPKPKDELMIAFLGSSAEVAKPSSGIQLQMADNPGRMSRGLPLLLAEQTYFQTHARVTTLIPVITRGGSGFVLSGRPWRDDEAARFAREALTPADFIVLLHVLAGGDPWTAQLRLVRASDATCLAALDSTFPFAGFGDHLPALARDLHGALVKHAGIRAQQPPALYQLPDNAHLAWYLLRLEQLLAVRATGLERFSTNFLSGEREIIDGNLQLCLACPSNATTRLLLAETIRYMKRIRPEVFDEFQARLATLQKEHPLAQPEHGIVQRMLDAS